MSKQADEILKKIEKDKIKPKSKWFFLAKDCLLWGLFVLTTLFGAVAMGAIIFIINDNDWDIYEQLEKNFLVYFLVLMPYFWIIILVIFSFIAYFNYTHTRKGYLLNPYIVVFGSITISVILGWFLFATGIGERIDKFCAQSFPYYVNNDIHKSVFWANPERGLLAGKITKIKDFDSFFIKDLKEKEWQIVGNKITWKDGAKLQVGEQVKIIGKINKQNDVFQAREIRPWGCGCTLCKDGQKSKSETCNGNLSSGSSSNNKACAAD